MCSSCAKVQSVPLSLKILNLNLKSEIYSLQDHPIFDGWDWSVSWPEGVVNESWAAVGRE